MKRDCATRRATSASLFRSTVAIARVLLAPLVASLGPQRREREGRGREVAARTSGELYVGAQKARRRPAPAR